MQVGVVTFSNTTRWFFSTDPNPNNTSTPTIECKRGQNYWIVNGQPRGCLGSASDLGIGNQMWGRFQFVTYGDGKWIARVRNTSTGEVADVAYVYLPYTNIARAEVVMEESWNGTNPSQNPWVNAGFYNYDLKYRIGSAWAHWPSNIGGNYGSITADEQSNSGADVCPGHYLIQPYIQSNPYLWWTGTYLPNLSNPICSGILYQGGGPSTAVTSIVGQSSNKLMSSNNGQGCVTTNKTVDGPFEQWSVKDLGNNIMTYGGNNAGKYMSRRTNNELWTEGTNINDNNARYYRNWINAPLVFTLQNLGNNLYVNHHLGSGCTKPDTNGQAIDTYLRYVAP